MTAPSPAATSPDTSFTPTTRVNGVTQTVIIQDYSPNSTCTWTPTVTATYTIVVYAREQGSTVAYDAKNHVDSYVVNPIPVPAITSFTPTTATTGTKVTISGSNFTGATAVAFGSTPRSFLHRGH